MDNQDVYIKRLQVQMEEWENEIERLRIKADKASADAQIEYRKQLEELRKRQDEMQAQYEKLNRAGNDAWSDVRDGADKAWMEFDAAIKRALTRFN
ncbi:MAG: hypothetical protein WDZ84_15450 [Rhodovibrionaceae bacterium]